MTSTPSIQLLRPAEAHKTLALGRTAVTEAISAGLLPPAIPLGARAIGDLKHELEAVIVARAAGRSDEDVRNLVDQLVLSRETTLSALTKYLH